MLFLFYGLDSHKSWSQSIALDDSTKIERMLDQLHRLTESNLDSALELSKTIKQKAQKLNDREGVWEARIEQGIIQTGLGYSDSSLLEINQVLKETQQQNNRLMQIKAHLGLAYTFQQNHNYKSSVDHLIQAEKRLQKEDPFGLHFDILNRQGIIHRLMKDNATSLKYFNLLENNYFNQLTSRQKFLLFMNKGNAYADQSEYGKTEELFKRAYEEIKKDNSPADLALITYNLGALFYRQKRYSEAKEYITKSLEANLKIGARAKIERCYRVLGSIYLDRKDYPRAINYDNMALKIAQSIKNPQSIMSNYNNLYLAYWDWGYYSDNIKNLDKALSYYQKYNQIKDSLYQVETTAKVLELEKQYETEKKNTQIALLEKENQHQEDEILVQHAQRNYLILIIILVSGILGIFIYFFYYYKKVNQLLQSQSKSILEQKDQISEQNVKLQKSVNTQNKLFSIIGHDLRSPLASIFSISQLIGFYIEDKNYEALEKTKKMMDHKTDQILDLTDNLLCWAVSQTDSLNPFFAPLSLKEIFDDCLELYRPIAGDKNITIECSEQTDLLVWADRNMVMTICRNLINNSVKFTHTNGHIHIWYEPKGQYALIAIKDSGIGIDQSKLGTLFEIGHEKTTRGTSGEKSTGLGLSICKEFVDAMNGQIWVESETGIGSQFIFELLLYDPKIHKPKQKSTTKTIISNSFSN